MGIGFIPRDENHGMTSEKTRAEQAIETLIKIMIEAYARPCSSRCVDMPSNRNASTP